MQLSAQYLLHHHTTTVLGANDGLVSVASLMMGIAAATPNLSTLLLSGISGLAAGAASMAVGEYISVSSQRDTERADIAREAAEHKKGPQAQQHEFQELVSLFEDKGIEHDLAVKVGWGWLGCGCEGCCYAVMMMMMMTMDCVCVPQQDQQIVLSRHIRQVAQQLTDKDVLKAHLWMELGIDTNNLANPLQV